jgi:hypothetical protein
MPYDMIARLITIPGHASPLFGVGLRTDCGSSTASTIVDDDGRGITLDLASYPLGYIAECPMVQLELLTSPPT